MCALHEHTSVRLSLASKLLCLQRLLSCEGAPVLWDPFVSQHLPDCWIVRLVLDRSRGKTRLTNVAYMFHWAACGAYLCLAGLGWPRRGRLPRAGAVV